jgi:hypothetical protein
MVFRFDHRPEIPAGKISSFNGFVLPPYPPSPTIIRNELEFSLSSSIGAMSKTAV